MTLENSKQDLVKIRGSSNKKTLFSGALVPWVDEKSDIYHGARIKFPLVEPNYTREPNITSSLPLDIHRYFGDMAKRHGKRMQTRAALMDSMIAAVFEYGYEGATVKEIGVNCGFAYGTFYNYFSNREEALNETASNVAFQIRGRINSAAINDDMPDIILIAEMYSFMKMAVARPAWAKILVESAHPTRGTHDLLSGQIQGLLQQGSKLGIFRTPLTPFLSLQIGELIKLAMTKMIAEDSTSKEATENYFNESCEAVLRLLGHSPSMAKQTVRISLKCLGV